MKLLALMNSVQEEIFAHKHIHQFNVIIMRCWERKTEFRQSFQLDITLSAHATWDNTVLCYVPLLPNEFCVSRHTDNVPDRTVQ